MQSKSPSTLYLADGSEYHGWSFGSANSAGGEVVFNTAMTGYPESLSDPSYKGQVLVLTYPLIGNYGVPEMNKDNGLPAFFESDRVQIAGLVVSEYSFEYSHWNALKSLSDWLAEHGVPGIYGVDTRKLTQKLREHGTIPGAISPEGPPAFFENPATRNLVDEVSTQRKMIYGSGKYRIVLVDCGVKYNIIRSLLKYNTTVIRVPWNYDYSNEDYDGLFISNGPGDPKQCKATIANLQNSLQDNRPVFGICLGHQLLSLASGADTYKLKYGHRSHNQPVLQDGSTRAYITSQNHGYAVENNSIQNGWQPWFSNLNDRTNEGVRHSEKPFFTTQFHPEASGGPSDTRFLFEFFIEEIRKWKEK